MHQSLGRAQSRAKHKQEDNAGKQILTDTRMLTILGVSLIITVPIAGSPFTRRMNRTTSTAAVKAASAACKTVMVKLGGNTMTIMWFLPGREEMPSRARQTITM